MGSQSLGQTCQIQSQRGKRVTCAHYKGDTWHDYIDDVATPQGSMWDDHTMTGHMSWQLTGKGTIQLGKSYYDTWQGSTNERLPRDSPPLAYISMVM
jgi:hypothetical protein